MKTDTEIKAPQGMSLRDYFAGQAISGIMGTPYGPSESRFEIDDVAMQAYRIADAMLECQKRWGE